MFVVKDADIAFANGAFISSILVSLSAVGTHLRAEYGPTENNNLFNLIDGSPLKEELKSELQELRKVRNRWVHVNTPLNDEALIADSESS